MKHMIILPLLLAIADGTWAACVANTIPTAPDNRYTDNGDGTVTDNQTGLMWKQCVEGLTTTTTACDTGSAGSYAWSAALQQAAASSFAQYSDWRLPNRNELNSLAERACFNPAINTTLFPATPSGYMWSSSPDANIAANAWGVDFNFGESFPWVKSFTYSVRLVRGQ